jgi:hypothetical protein
LINDIAGKFAIDHICNPVTVDVSDFVASCLGLQNGQHVALACLGKFLEFFQYSVILGVSVAESLCP